MESMTSKKATRLPPRSEDDFFKDAYFAIRSELHPRTIKAVLNHLCWQWTVRHGKILKCAYRSRKAHRLLKGVTPGPNFKRIKQEHGLIHEHVVPRKVIVQYLTKMSHQLTLEEVREVFVRLAIGAIVTGEENDRLNKYRSSMPDDFDLSEDLQSCDPWARYRKLRITIVDRNGRSIGDATK
ncbi:MAG: hypothetical protein CMJ58_26250 [Planctomycetaceae bacterium]|nr:hypothetical protein [Planctomycetaceae bacterium]